MSVDLFEPANALDSLRNSDFDALSAYGEAVDNSLQAGAKNISIVFECAPPRQSYQQIDRLVFCDDGHGMSKDVLHSCLKLGWSSRYNDRSGIGRFGVGMILGAIHEVKRIEVYSREKGGAWRWTYIDLDEIQRGELSSIPEPQETPLPSGLTPIPGSDSGTIVVWSKYDRQKKSGHLIIDEAKHWFGRTFRYFIWDGIAIKLNSEIVNAHDPLYARTMGTKFPDDPIGKAFKTIELPWKVSTLDQVASGSENSIIEIKMSLLPEEFRVRRGDGGNPEATARYIDENEGISILRNRREVFYGTLPYWSSVRWSGNQNTWKFDEIDRWWGCEILFSAELDSDFTVKNIKRGADPIGELKASIKQQITPTRTSSLDEIRRVWNATAQADQDEKNEKDGNLGRGAHSKAEDVAKNSPTPKSQYNATKSAEETSEIADQALSDLDDDKKSAYAALFSSQPFTISESTWRGSTFWEVYHAGGNTLLSYNKGHKFFEEIYRLMDGLENGEIEPADVAADIRVLTDLLLISAAKSQALNDEETSVPRIGDFLEQYNEQWGMMLQSYVTTWLRERPDGQ